MRAIIRRILGLLFGNFGYKFLSVLLAVIVWAIIQGEQVQEVNREILVSIHVTSGFGVRGELVRIKAATIRGPQAWLLEVPKRLSAEVFVPPGKVGQHRIRLSKDDVKNVNDRLELIIHEPYLDLYVDRLMERTIPIKEAIHGTPADGFIVEKVSIEPKSIVAKGIRSDLLQLRTIYTEPIDVSGYQESRSIDVGLVSPGLGADALSHELVKVNIQIGDSRINKRFANIPVDIIGAEHNFRVKPQFVSVLVQGTPTILNFLKRTDFKAYIDARGLGLGRYEEEIKVKIPPETVLIETFPEKGSLSVQGE